jgi:GR25 family glycosyltransferase involved in LPS biosynthesis
MIFDIVQTPYVFNIEDDWEFFFSDDYITKMLYVLTHSDQKIGQVLVNLNYAEDTTHYSSVKGATSYVIGDISYWIHNHYTGEELHYQNQKLGCSNSLYWPHFSLRVGITRMDVLREIGPFNEKANHFEMEYANRYTSSGYKTAFLNGVFCLHIGRRTYERHTEKTNAYDLNRENQFGESSTIERRSDDTIKSTQSPKQIEIRTFVINLKRRVDRLQTFVNTNEGKIVSFDVVDGFDGKNGQTSHKIMKAFKSGDYDYRSGIVGCAISHVNVWKLFLQDRTTEYAIILEDDVDVCHNFQDKIVYLIQRYQEQFDVIMLHQNPWQKMHFEFQLGIPKADFLTVEQAFKQNMGSAAAYIVSRKGATQLLQHVSEKGMYNAVDWVIMKSGAIQRVLYSVPQLVKANCFQTGQADTDIQTDYTKLKWSDDQWDKYEIEYIHNMLLTSVYYNETKIKQISLTIRGDNSVEKELLSLFDGWIPKDKFIFSKTEGLINIIYTHTLLWTRLVDYVFIIPIDKVKTEDYRQLNRYTVKWYTTNRYMYIIPDKYVTSKVLQDKVFGNKYLNLVQPF